VLGGSTAKEKHCAVRGIETSPRGQEWVSLRITHACLKIGSLAGKHPGSPSAQSLQASPGNSLL